MKRKCDWNGQYWKDDFDNLFFQCIYCGQELGLEEKEEVDCSIEECTSECHYTEKYGFVPEAGCEIHDK